MTHTEIAEAIFHGKPFARTPVRVIIPTKTEGLPKRLRDGHSEGLRPITEPEHRFAVIQALESVTKAGGPFFYQVSEFKKAEMVVAFSVDVEHRGFGYHAGNVWLAPVLGEKSWTPGSASYRTLLHEIMHSVAGRHPDECGVPAEEDGPFETVLSRRVRKGGPLWADTTEPSKKYPSAPGPVDQELLALAYPRTRSGAPQQSKDWAVDHEYPDHEDIEVVPTLWDDLKKEGFRPPVVGEIIKGKGKRWHKTGKGK
jgi:hypothetical protein